MSGTSNEDRKIIPLLRKALELHKDDPEMIVMFTDTFSGDVIVNGDHENIIKTFQSFHARIVFSVDRFCSDDSLISK